MEFDVMQFISKELIILIVAQWIIGYFLKKSNHVADWLIPWILLVLSIIGASFMIGFNISAVLQGILCTGVAVLGKNLTKQTQEALSEMSKEKETE